MFCRNCGVENDDQAVFCKECGVKLVADTNDAMMGQMNQNTAGMDDFGNYCYQPASVGNPLEPLGKLLKKVPKMVWIIAGGLIAAIIVVAIIIGCMPTTVKLDDYVTVTYEGYNGYGQASASVDWDAVRTKYGDKIKFKDEKSKKFLAFLGEESASIDYLASNVSITLDKTSELSNGEEIKYTWEVDEDEITSHLKCKVKYEEETVQVEGLEEVQAFDAFEGLSVSFTGVEPQGYAEYEYNGDLLSYYDFDIDQTNNLSNGDKIVISLSTQSPDYYIRNYGKMPSAFEKEFTVSGLTKYVSEAGEISEEAADEINKQSLDVIKAYTLNLNDNVMCDEVKCVGSYLAVAKSADNNNTNNIVGYIYEISAHVQPEEGAFATNVRNYYDVRYFNIGVGEDGACSVDVSRYDTPNDNFGKKVFYGTKSYEYINYYFTGYESLTALQKEREKDYIEYYTIQWDISEQDVSAVDMEEDMQDSESSEYICKYSSQREMTPEDIQEYLAKDVSAYGFPGDRNIVQMIINEMYAKKGYEFSDDELNQYFGQKEWYQNIERKTNDMDTIYDNMSELEKNNIILLEEYK